MSRVKPVLSIALPLTVALAVCCSGRAAGQEEAGEAVQTAPLPEVIAVLAEQWPSPPVGLRYSLGKPKGASLLDGYVARTLSSCLQRRDVPCAVVEHDPVEFVDGPPQCLVRVLKARGVTLFVRCTTVLDEDQQWLAASVYDLRTGQKTSSTRLAFHLPEGLQVLGDGAGKQLEPADRKWAALLEDLFARVTANHTDQRASPNLVEAEYFYETGLWAQAGERYMADAPDGADLDFARAVIALQAAGLSERGRQAVQAAVALHPDSGPLYALSAWLTLRQGEPDDALILLEQARTWDMVNRGGDESAEGAYLHARGLMALEQGDVEAAGTLLSRAADLLASKLFAQVEAARFHWGRGDAAKAVSYFERATETDACTADTWAELAVLRDATDDLDGAIEALGEAFRLRRDRPIMARQLASRLRRAGRRMDGLDVLRQAAEANPCSPAALAAYGDEAAHMWLVDLAEEQFRQAVGVSADFSYGAVRLAEVLALQHSFGEAEALLNELLTAHPEYQPGRLALARMLSQLDRFGEAIALAGEAAKAPEHEVNTRLALARIHMRAGQSEEGLRNAQLAVASRPDAETYVALSQAFVATGQLDNAESAAMNAIERAPASAGAQLALARVRMVQESLDDADSAASAAIELDPYFFDALALAGEVKRRRGEPAECAALWQRALELNPWDAGLHGKMAEVLADELGDPERARAHCLRLLDLQRAPVAEGL